jgi:hypothetical protein
MQRRWRVYTDLYLSTEMQQRWRG